MVAIFPSRLPATTILHHFSAGFAIILFLCVPLSAQEPPIQFERFGPRQGLSKANLYDIYQDVHGYIWMENFRYDGQELKMYLDGNAMAVRLGEMLAENWGKEPDSAYYFDPYKDSFIDNYPDGAKQFIRSVRPASWDTDNCSQCILKDETQDIWFGLPADGLFIYRRATKSYTHLKNRADTPLSLSSNRVSTMIKSRDNRIWIGTWDAGLNLWLKDSSFQDFRHEPGNSSSLSSDSVTILKEDHRGNIWIGTFQGLNRLDPATMEVERIPFPQ